MSAATAARDEQRKATGDPIAYKLGIIKVYKGTLVSLRADGYLYPSRSGTASDIFVGVAYETVDNTAGAAGDKSAKVQTSGTYVFAKSGAAITDLGLPMYASDDSTLTATATSNQFVGRAVELIDSSNLRISIEEAAQLGLAEVLISGISVANVADSNVVGGVPVLFRIPVPAGVTGNVDVVSTHKVRVIDAWLVKTTAAGGGGGTIQVKNGATAITDAISIDIADKAIARAATIDDAQHEIAAAGTLRITRTRTASTDETCIVYVLAIRVA